MKAAIDISHRLKAYGSRDHNVLSWRLPAIKLLRTPLMLYSASSDHWVFVVDKDSFPKNSFYHVVNRIYSSIKSRQVIKVAKQEVKFHNLIQELVDPTSTKIKENSLKQDLTQDDTYYFEMAAFEIQDTDFYVPTNRFVEKTDPEHFPTIFGPTFGTNETPNQFPGVTADDFRSLMEYLYPLDIHNSADELTIDDWAAILKLSTKWRMPTLREEAIQKLNDNSNRMPAIMKVQLGNECMITEWVRSGYVALVEREEHFTEADVIAIGLNSVTKLCELREQKYAEEWDTYCNRLTLEAHETSNLIADRISQVSAVDHLGHDDDDFVTAILDAQSLGNQRLMLDAWGRMARRLESLTLEEVERLTLGIALMMWEVRLETRRAAWSLVQEYGAKCNVTALDASKRIASAFASELEDIEAQAINYALFKPSLDKGKKPEVCAYEEGGEEIPDSALEPMPSSATKLFKQSLALRQMIADLEKKSNTNADATSGIKLQNELRRYKLSAQKWCTLVVGASTPDSTLDLSTVASKNLLTTLKEMVTELILKNAGSLFLDGNSVDVQRWRSTQSKLLSFTRNIPIETRVFEDRRVIELILPVSES